MTTPSQNNQPPEPQYVDVDQAFPEQPLGGSKDPQTILQTILTKAELLDPKKLNPTEGLPESGGVIFADLVPEIGPDGALTLNVNKFGITSRAGDPASAVENFLLVLASLEGMGVKFKFPTPPQQAPQGKPMAAKPTAPVATKPAAPAAKPATPAKAAAPAAVKPATPAQPKPVAPATPPPPEEPPAPGNSGEVFYQTITKVVINPLVGGKFEIKCFEKPGFQYEFLKSYPMERADAVKHLMAAGWDGEAMCDMAATAPQAFQEPKGIGLAWRFGGPQKKDPTKHYKNFVGLYDLATGWQPVS